jgi:hypothetical protein
VLAFLCQSLEVPIVHVNILPLPNPDSANVETAFLKGFNAIKYEAIDSLDSGGNNESKRHSLLFEPASQKYGHRYISGIRAEESAARRSRPRENSKNTCTPLLKWTQKDIFAYLQMRILPIHANYAMSDGGAFPREHLRVSSLSGTRGNNRDRKVWTDLYYSDIVCDQSHLS